jgi:hypothetical protein
MREDINYGKINMNSRYVVALPFNVISCIDFTSKLFFV